MYQSNAYVSRGKAAHVACSWKDAKISEIYTQKKRFWKFPIFNGITKNNSFLCFYHSANVVNHDFPLNEMYERLKKTIERIKMMQRMGKKKVS